MKFFRDILITALSALILCSVALSRKSKSKVAGAWDDCKPLCEEKNAKARIYQHRDFGKNGTNRKFICECQGKDSSEFQVIDMDFNGKFQSIPANTGSGAISKGLFVEVKTDKNGKPLNKRKRRY